MTEHETVTKADVDSKITTHKGDASAHHAKYTDAAAQAVADARIAIHAAIAAAHHAVHLKTLADHALGTVVPHDSLAGLTSKPHSGLTGIGPSDHHAKYTDAEAKAAAVQAGAITDGVTKAPTHDAVYDVKVTADTATTPAEVDSKVTTHGEGAKHRWTLNKIRVGAGPDADPAEVDPPLGVMDFWSVTLESITLTDIIANGTNVPLPDVVVAIPTGATVVRAVAMFKFRMLDNPGAANALQGDQYIGVQKGGSGGYDNAIFLDDNMFGIAEATREGGDVVVGSINVATKVNGDATYNLQWTASLVDVADLKFCDVQTGLKIWYSV